MGWLTRIARPLPHECLTPDEEISDGSVEVGSTWMCEQCGQVYLVRYARTGMFWYFSKGTAVDDESSTAA